MSPKKIAAAVSVVLAALMMPSIHAQDQAYNPQWSGTPTGAYYVPHQESQYGQLAGVPRQVSYTDAQGPGGTGIVPPTPIDPAPAVTGVPTPEQGYVRLGAPMYPTPRPNIPIWVGSTVITNQALAPHEMLYPHTYRALYPPYYHRVKGHWLLTPLGVRSHERWQLQGTMVEVKYRSHYPGVFSGACWHPPATSYMHGAWK